MKGDTCVSLFRSWGREPAQVARDNKLVDLYLEMQDGSGARNTELYATRRSRMAITQSVKALAARAEAVAVDWAVFKTLRPFPFTPSDVDAVVFTTNGSRRLADSLLLQGYNPSWAAPYTISVHDTRNDVGIDLYQDIAASRFIYLDRATLRPHRTWQDIDGVSVPVLQPTAELLSILAHAVYKEQMFTLADYVTVRCYGETVGQAEWETLFDLAEANGVRNAVLWCLRLTKGIAHLLQEAPPWTHAVDRALGSALIPRKVPCRLVNPRTLSAALAERISASGMARRSIAWLIAQSLNPASPHTRSFYRQLWKRAKGETY